MKKTALWLVLALAFFALGRFSASPESRSVLNSSETHSGAQTSLPTPEPAPNDDDTNHRQGLATLADAYTRRLQDVAVEASGRVINVLPDDNQGSRHQRFLLDTGLGHTLLVAHNIDLAPRIEGLQRGDVVQFKGEYVWNEKGGVVHWTHHDPKGRHPGGWLKHDGRTYE